MYDIGGYRLHLQSRGSGSPAAVMDSGLGGNSILWTNALSAVAEHTQACAFDRAGYAWSQPAPPDARRTSQQIVAELRLLLASAGLQPPYILIGHSFGGINMLVYAYQYPQEVAGLVLVDSSHPEMFERMPGVPPPKTVERMLRFTSGLAQIGLLRLLSPTLARQLLPEGQQALPPEAWQAMMYFARGAKEYQTAAREASAGDENFAQARGATGSLGDLQLEVLTADWWTIGKPTAMKKAALELREEMARLSSRGCHRIVSGCDHTNLPVVRPDAVADSVGHILEIWRGE
jgi:pimeloyl-ACP methyl ester carboxylesterase